MASSGGHNKHDPDIGFFRMPNPSQLDISYSNGANPVPEQLKDNFIPKETPSYSFRIQNKILFTISKEGDLEVNPEYFAGQVAIEFWNTVIKQNNIYTDALERQILNLKQVEAELVLKNRELTLRLEKINNAIQEKNATLGRLADIVDEEETP